jgi:hypothetical protein
MLGNLSASLWSMLRSIVRISMSFLVRCISPFCRSSRVLESSDFALESDGEDIVAATRAAMAAASFGGPLFDPSGSPLSLSLFPFSPPSLAANKSFRNCGVSIAGIAGTSGSLSSETRAVMDLTLSDAVSKISCTVSWAEFIQAPVFCLTSNRLRMKDSD